MRSFCICLLAIVAVLVGLSSTASTEWIYQDAARKGGPEMKWASQCDFIPEEDCGRLCLAEAHCFHFVWIGGICYLNPESNRKPVISDIGDVPRCGFIANRQQKSGDWQVTQSHKSDEYNMMTSPRTTTESSLPTFTTATPTTPETTTSSSTKFTTKKKKVATGTIIFG